MITKSNDLEKGVQFPEVKNEKRKLGLFREEVSVRGKDGPYPAVQSTFAALTEQEKNEMFRLVDALGFPREQLQTALDTILRHAVIVLIFDKKKTKAIGTALVGLFQQFGSEEIGISRLGSFVLGYAFVDEAYRGKHLGKELLRLRFDLLKSNYFQKYVQQSSSKNLRISSQKLSGNAVSKRMLLSATDKENLLVYCDLRDKDAHFGRCVEAAEAAGMAVTPLVEKIMKPYSQMTVKQYDDYLLLYVYIGVPATNMVKGESKLSRRNVQQPIYFYGNKKLREQIVNEVSRRLVAGGAQYQESASYYFGCPPEIIWAIVTDLSKSKKYETILDQPNSPETTAKYSKKFKGSSKLHMVSVQKYDTYRFAAGFPSNKKKRR